MTTILLSVVVLATVFAAMAVGVIVRGRPIKGSCGGIASLGMGQACDICGGDQKKCDDSKKPSTLAAKARAEYYEAK